MTQKINLRTKHAELTYNQINLFENTYRLFRHGLDPQDTAHFDAYIAEAKRLYHAGMFDTVGLLSHLDWDKKFNFRHDLQSIRGTHGEFLIHICRNLTDCDTRSRVWRGTQADELAGWDGEVYKLGSWSKVFFQSKLLTLGDSGSLIKIYDNYLSEKYTAHRLALPDINADTRIVLEMDLPILRNALLIDQNDKLIHSRFTEWNREGTESYKGTWINRSYLLERPKLFEYHEFKAPKI